MAIAGRARGDTCGERGLDDMTGGEREGETVIGNTDCAAGDRGDDPDSVGVAPPCLLTFIELSAGGEPTTCSSRV